MRMLVTGGAGFIGSHVAEHYAKEKNEVVVFDNLSRANILGKSVGDSLYNWNYLKACARRPGLAILVCDSDLDG